MTNSELRPRLADFHARTELPRVFIRGNNHAAFGATIYALRFRAPGRHPRLLHRNEALAHQPPSS